MLVPVVSYIRLMLPKKLYAVRRSDVNSAEIYCEGSKVVYFSEKLQRIVEGYVTSIQQSEACGGLKKVQYSILTSNTEYVGPMVDSDEYSGLMDYDVDGDKIMYPEEPLIAYANDTFKIHGDINVVKDAQVVVYC